MRASVIIALTSPALLLAGCYLPPPGYGYYPRPASAYGPARLVPNPTFRAAEDQAWTGSGQPIYVLSPDRPGCVEYRSTRTVDGVAQPLVRTICPAPDGSLRVVTGSADTP